MCKTYDEAIALLKTEEFKYDFPIKKGDGKSLQTALEIENFVSTYFVKLEYEIVEFIGIHTNKTLTVKIQSLKMTTYKYYDILQIEEVSEKGEISEFKIYFDITTCFKKKYNKN
jgi:hypothetical protein